MVSPLPRNHAVDVPGNVNNTLAALTGVRVGHATHLDDQSGTLWGSNTGWWGWPVGSGLVRSCCDLVLADESTQDRSAANLVIGEVDHWWWLGFRAKVWRPSLVRAGLLGKIVEVGPRKVMAHWHDGEGRECSKQFPTAREATEHLVKYAHGALRFHDLRHSWR
jgi:hypothetical protein